MRIVVVGAGILGASVAHHLARRGASVTVVDPARRSASSATARSFGWIGAAALDGRAVADWRRLASEVDGVDIRWCGALTWAGPAGEPVGAERIAELEPNLRRPPAQAGWQAGDGCLDAAAATRALLRGVEVLEETTVTSVRYAGTRAVGVETSAGPVRADTVVLACGTGIPRLCPAVAVASSPAVLMRFSAPPGLVRTVVSSPEVEVREGRDAELLVPEIPDGDTSAPALRRIAEQTRSALAATFRGADDVTLLDISVGDRPMPPGPTVGPVPGAAGLHVAVMHSAVTLAATVGRRVADDLVPGGVSGAAASR